jgi:DnaJ-class molecular chaperone
MRHRIEYAEGTYRERIPCESCNGRGSIQPVMFGEREAPDTRERETCEACDGQGWTVLELDGPEAEEAALRVGILTSSGAVAA